MNKKVSLGAAIAMIVFVAATSIFITMAISMQLFNTDSSTIGSRTEITAKITEIDKIVKGNYVGDIDDEHLTEGIADGYFNGLGDSHSYYMTAEEYSQTTILRDGKSNDIGVYVTDNNAGGLYIYYVMPNSPANNAGIQEGDVITAISGSSVKDLGYENASELLKTADQTFELTITREDEELSIVVTPKEFNSTTVEVKVMGEIGYIRIYNFVESTDDQFLEAIDLLLKQEVTGIIFDVRHNSGGMLSPAVEMIDRICPAGDIVSKTDKDGKTTVLHKSDSTELNIPMVVLIDEGTASASELFACALRDYDKAELIGLQSYGKGSMQEIYTFKDGSAINLTTALYNPPKSENYDGIGLTPDHVVAIDPEPNNFYMVSDDEDTQLQYALGYLMQE